MLPPSVLCVVFTTWKYGQQNAFLLHQLSRFFPHLITSPWKLHDQPWFPITCPLFFLFLHLCAPKNPSLNTEPSILCHFGFCSQLKTQLPFPTIGEQITGINFVYWHLIHILHHLNLQFPTFSWGGSPGLNMLHSSVSRDYFFLNFMCPKSEWTHSIIQYITHAIVPSDSACLSSFAHLKNLWLQWWRESQSQRERWGGEKMSL